MKKLLFILIGVIFLSGCGLPNPPFGAETPIADNLLLKVSKDRVLSSEKFTIPEQTIIASSTGKTIIIPAETFVQYDYISFEEVSGEVYKNYNEIISKRINNVQYFEKGNNGIAKIYLDERFGGVDNKYLVKSATTTLDAWNTQNKVSLLDLFIKGANALTDITATNNKDNGFQEGDPDKNNGSSASVYIEWYGSKKSRSTVHFTLPSGTGTISLIKFYLYCSSPGGTGSVDVHQLSRTDWTEAGETYNKYDGTNNWTTAGGDYSATVIDTIDVPGAAGWLPFVLQGTGATNPLSLTWADNIHLFLKITTESGADVYCTSSSKENATTANRPYLEITYTIFIPQPSIY